MRLSIWDLDRAAKKACNVPRFGSQLKTLPSEQQMLNRREDLELLDVFSAIQWSAPQDGHSVFIRPRL